MKRTSGFTLIELMIVIAIIGILAAVAVPQYGQYSKRAKFADVIAQVVPVKTAVGMCIQDNDSIDSCSSDHLDIASVITTTGKVASVDVDKGTITATGTSDVANAVYKIIPDYNSTKNSLVWNIDNSIPNACQNLKLCK